MVASVLDLQSLRDERRALDEPRLAARYPGLFLLDLSPEVPAVLVEEDILTVGRHSFQVHTPRSLFDALEVMDLVGAG